jgi:hypothetical protein
MPHKGKIWIDLDNSPHVPFFVPIIEELEKRNYSLVITARDCFQTRGLADLYHLNYRLIGHHSGKNKIRKLAGLGVRALQLMPILLRERPDVALSVCSRSQLIVSSLWRIPSIFTGDYEYSTPWAFVRPNLLIVPEVISNSDISMEPSRVRKYPGIKEDVYVPRFVPDARIRPELGLQEQDIVATLRPPANEAHYHNPQSEELFHAAVEMLSKFPAVKLVVCPRNEKQAVELKKRWPALFENGTMRIPARVVNGLDLIWTSDFVISGGGTMNREAAALGVPVYSVFRGKIGAVDRYLAGQGRLVLLESVDDAQTKIAVERRHRPDRPEVGTKTVLHCIVDHIVAFIEAQQPSQAIHRGIKLGGLASTAGKQPQAQGSSELIK